MPKFNQGGYINTGRRSQVASPIRTRVQAGGQPDAKTHEGGAAYSREPKGELFLLAVSNLVGEDTFYEGATERDKRYRDLIAQVAISDPIWLFDMLVWLRAHGNMRSAPIVGAVEAVRTWLALPASDEVWHAWQAQVEPWLAARANADKCPGVPHRGHASSDWTCPRADQRSDRRGLARTLIDAVCQRADEPGEMVAYHFGRYGRKLPMPIKRGLADAVRRLYTEYSTLKYDTATRGGGGGFRFADVIELCHPKPWAGPMPTDPDRLAEAERIRATRSALFKHVIDTRHNRTIDRIEERLDLSLPMIDANHTLRWMLRPKDQGGGGQPRALLDPDNVRGAGLTWEDVLSLGGSLGLPKRDLWESVIPGMGYMALLRNLRNFDEQGVSEQVADQVIRRLVDPDQVARSRQFPFRFYSAYKNAPNLRWGRALDTALTLSTQNIPVLPGRTLVLIDTSGSMSYGHVSGRSQMTYAEVAALFGVALAIRADRARSVSGDEATVEVHGFGDSTFHHKIKRGSSLLTEVTRFNRRNGEAGHGTDIANAVASTYSGHDRVILISDMQTMDGDRFASYGWGRRRMTADQLVPDTTPVYGFNLQGYSKAAMPSGSGNRHEIGGGLTDATFRLIPMLEAGKLGEWPWALPPGDPGGR